MNPRKRGESWLPALLFRLIKFQGRRSIAVSVSRRPRSAVVLAPLRSGADGVFSSCVNRFYAECNRARCAREIGMPPHCLFQKPLVPDDTLSFYPIRNCLYCSSKLQDVMRICLFIIKIIYSTEIYNTILYILYICVLLWHKKSMQYVCKSYTSKLFININI